MGQQYYGATYDFGILKAYAGYISAKYSNQAAPSSYLQRSAQQIGVRSYITPTIEAWASGGSGSMTGQNLAQSAAALVATNSSSLKQNFTGYQLGTNYWLSKRTNMYAIYGSTQVSSSSVAISEGGSSYGVGVRHTF
jgi:predicted porin